MKNMNWKKCLSLFLAVLMLVGMVPVNALAVDEPEHVHGEDCDHDHEHTFVAGETVAPTCTVGGYTLYSCQCGASEQRDEVAAAGHSYVDTVIAPTAEAQGYTEYVCSVCNDTYRDNYTQKENSSGWEELLAQAEVLLVKYQLTAGMGEDAMVDVLLAMDSTVQEQAAGEVEALESAALVLAAEEQAVLYADATWQTLEAIGDLLEMVMTPVTMATDPLATIVYDSALGSVTVAGQTVADGEAVPVAAGTTVIATTASDVTFLGWVNGETGEILSTDASYNMTLTSNTTVKVAFAKADAKTWFRLGTKYLFDDLNAAAAHPQAASLKVILAADGTLPAGSYTIPAGAILLIPFDVQDTCYTEEPAPNASGVHVYETPTAFRTLTMANGANITVLGAISLSAKHAVAAGSKPNGGSPSGPVSFIRMNGNSSITLESGSNLYAWGFITGSGSVVAKSGANVWENFQIMDFRGGTVTMEMAGGDKGVFPMSQYYVQNIEVPLTVYPGAKEHSYTTIVVSGTNYSSSVGFIGGNGSMFNLTSGFVTKRYDGASDRLMVELEGTMKISPIELNIKGLLGVNSSGFDLPINGNLSLSIRSGSNVIIDQDIAMLPGAEIQVNKGAVCTLGSGRSVFIYDADNWGNFCGPRGETISPVQYAPSKTGTRSLTDAVIRVDGTMNAEAGYVYTTAGGANIYSTGSGIISLNPGSEKSTYQLVQHSYDTTYTPIAITPAVLKNADGTVVATASDKGSYVYARGIWHTPACGAKYVGQETTAPSCSAEGVKTYTCGCGDEYTEAIAKLNHTPGSPAEENRVEPTCTDPGGYDTVTRCSVCTEIITTRHTDISATGHNIQGVTAVKENETKSTCVVAGGYDMVKHCNVCGEVAASEHTTLPLADHTPGEPVQENVVESTCQKAGSYEEVVYCAVDDCGYEISRTKKSIPRTDHVPKDPVIEVEEESTCKVQGYGWEVVYCKYCDRFMDEWEIDLPLADHTPGTPVKENEVAATCYAEGGYDMVAYCTVSGCGEEASRTHYAQEMLTHTPGQPKRENEVASTCYAEGSYDEVIYCSVAKCGATISSVHKTVEKLTHTPGPVVRENGKAATCYAEGGYDEVIYCSVAECKEELSRTPKTIGKLEHTPGDPVRENEVAATCKAEGSYNEVVYCSVAKCGERLSSTLKTIGKTGHTPGAEATCTEAKRCTVCEIELQPMQGHDHQLNQELSTAPDCTNTGENVYVCSRCDDSYTETVPVLGHDWKELDRKEPTCTEPGSHGGRKCERCEATEPGSEIPPEHKPGDPVRENEVPATCYAGGSYDEVIYCSVEGCGAEISRITNPINKTEHTPGSPVKEKVVASTCYAEGSYDEVVYCSVANCGEELSRSTKTIEKLKHTPGEVVREKEVAATCYSEGSCEEVTYCSTAGCGVELSRTARTLDKINHTSGSPVKEKVVAATCYSEGSYNEVVYCSVADCGEKLSSTPRTIDKLDHTPGDPMRENVHESTCKVEGSYDEVVCCAVAECGAEISRVEKALPKADHTPVKDAAVEATCKDTGLTEGSHCSVCDVVLVEQEIVPTNENHRPRTLRPKDPTCEDTGLTEGSYCTLCEKVLEAQEEIPSRGHTPVIDKAVEPTCTKTGLKEGSHCDVCGNTILEQEVVPSLGHIPVIDKAVEATCTEPGLTEGSHCDVCGSVLTVQEGIPVAGHTPVIDKGLDPTCTEPGLTDGKHCNVCGEVIESQTEIPANGHTEVTDAAVPPTCEDTGLTEGIHCAICNEVIVAQEEVPFNDHDWDDGVVTTLPTCTETGIRTFTCGECGSTRPEEEPANGHTLTQHPAKSPTYTNIGWEAYESCESCDYSTYVEIPALGEAVITTYDQFLKNLAVLEELTDTYVKKMAPGKDPAGLIIKYIRTGVDRYNTGSWNIMAGYEDADFAKYIAAQEENHNNNLTEGEPLMEVTALKNVENFILPNGNYVDFGHMFGSMDITYTNKSSQGHMDVSGWAGDLADLMSLSDQFGVESTTIEGMVAEIKENYFLRFEEEFPEELKEGTFSLADVYGDLDAYYIMQQLYGCEYENGTLTDIISDYMTASLTDAQRAAYFLKNRLGGVSLRTDIRDAVYNEYHANSVVATLENTREFDIEDITSLRKACSYVFADYLCALAGDFVDIVDNPFYTVFSTVSSTLAPGITQKIYQATTVDDETMVYYIATADVTRPDVHVFANYRDNDPSKGWGMQRVLDQANAAQTRYSDPASDRYIENFNIIASVNGCGYDMHTGEPGGLLVMEGYQWHPSNGHLFFGILDDGTAMIGSHEEYERLYAQGKVKEALSAFGTPLIRNGKIAIDIQADSQYFNNRASRTAAGITATGKVVFMVLDGRQKPFSCGGSMEEIAQIMLEAGCVDAINLDGGGSSTYVARTEGSTELSVVSKPSDGAARSVSTSLFMASTAPSSTAFDHAVIGSDYTYMTVGTALQMNAQAVSATGNVVDMPEGVSWVVNNSSVATISTDGVLTAKANGTVQVQLMLDETAVGEKTIYVVNPDNVYFSKKDISAIYGESIRLPVKAAYEGKNVLIREADVTMSPAVTTAGTVEGFCFTGDEASGLKKVVITAALTWKPSITGSINVALFSKDEASFDFENATGGDRQLSWNREVSNATTQSSNVYRVVDSSKDMVTSYTFALDMSQIEIPEQLSELTYMLPGADLEGASAWSFLLQLAERISVLTEVRAELQFDPSLAVDYSDMTVVNEYFIMKEPVYDAETNKLTIIMNWKDQTEPIDADTANPLCIVTGIKLTPKEDAAWTSAKQLNLVNKGDISYKIYMRATALYAFSQKVENQQIFGLYPFINPNDENEKGASFGSVYKQMEDGYTLINARKEGWVMEEGGYAYYKDGQRYTGVQEVEGYYYDFGENGINVGQTKFTGDMTENGKSYYLHNGVKQSGWVIIDEKTVRYCNPNTQVSEKLTVVETPSTCIVDGHCDYTSESGAMKTVNYDDAGGHEYVLMADGVHYKCSVCGHERWEMSEATLALSSYAVTYTGKGVTVGTTVTAPNGAVLTKPGQSSHPDYASTYKNNVNVGTASVTVSANRYGIYVNLLEWRGNAAGSKTAYYEIRPDLPTNVTIQNQGDKSKISWTAAKAPGVTYVLYHSSDLENWTEYTTTATEYTVNTAELNSYHFRLGTRKEVNGQTYNSISCLELQGKAPIVVSDSRPGTGKPTLSWGTVTGAKEYQVYRSTKASSGYIKIYTTTGNTFTNNSAAVDQIYYYRVRAVMNDGSLTGFGNTVTGKALCGKVTAWPNSASSASIAWNTVDGAETYVIYRAEGDNGTFAQLATTSSTGYTDTTAVKGSTYCYQVAARSAAGNIGERSDVIQIQLPAAEQPPVNPPEDSPSGDGTIDVSGIAQLNEGYVVEVDGVRTIVGTNGLVIPGEGEPRILTYYEESQSSDKDPEGIVAHQEYPSKMYAWYLAYDAATDTYKPQPIPQLNNFLLYQGTSIRLKGNQGIRIFTAVNEANRSKLINGTLLTGELSGYRLVEYGTLFKWGEKTVTPLLYGASAKSVAFNAKTGMDAVFSRQGGAILYTGMLTGIDPKLCGDELVLRPYMVLEKNGEQIVVYGGTLQRNIGYVAYQNRSENLGADGTTFIRNILKEVYNNTFGL